MLLANFLLRGEPNQVVLDGMEILGAIFCRSRTVEFLFEHQRPKVERNCGKRDEQPLEIGREPALKYLSEQGEEED